MVLFDPDLVPFWQGATSGSPFGRAALQERAELAKAQRVPGLWLPDVRAGGDEPAPGSAELRRMPDDWKAGLVRALQLAQGDPRQSASDHAAACVRAVPDLRVGMAAGLQALVGAKASEVSTHKLAHLPRAWADVALLLAESMSAELRMILGRGSQQNMAPRCVVTHLRRMKQALTDMTDALSKYPAKDGVPSRAWMDACTPQAPETYSAANSYMEELMMGLASIDNPRAGPIVRALASLVAGSRDIVLMRDAAQARARQTMSGAVQRFMSGVRDRFRPLWQARRALADARAELDVILDSDLDRAAMTTALDRDTAEVPHYMATAIASAIFLFGFRGEHRVYMLQTRDTVQDLHDVGLVDGDQLQRVLDSAPTEAVVLHLKESRDLARALLRVVTLQCTPAFLPQLVSYVGLIVDRNGNLARHQVRSALPERAAELARAIGTECVNIDTKLMAAMGALSFAYKMPVLEWMYPLLSPVVLLEREVLDAAHAGDVAWEMAHVLLAVLSAARARALHVARQYSSAVRVALDAERLDHASREVLGLLVRALECARMAGRYMTTPLGDAEARELAADIERRMNAIIADLDKQPTTYGGVGASAVHKVLPCMDTLRSTPAGYLREPQDTAGPPGSVPDTVDMDEFITRVGLLREQESGWPGQVRSPEDPPQREPGADQGSGGLGSSLEPRVDAMHRLQARTSELDTTRNRRRDTSNSDTASGRLEPRPVYRHAAVREADPPARRVLHTQALPANNALVIMARRCRAVVAAHTEWEAWSRDVSGLLARGVPSDPDRAVDLRIAQARGLGMQPVIPSVEQLRAVLTSAASHTGRGGGVPGFIIVQAVMTQHAVIVQLADEVRRDTRLQSELDMLTLRDSAFARYVSQRMRAAGVVEDAKGANQPDHKRRGAVPGTAASGRGGRSVPDMPVDDPQQWTGQDSGNTPEREPEDSTLLGMFELYLNSEGEGLVPQLVAGYDAGVDTLDSLVHTLDVLLDTDALTSRARELSASLGVGIVPWSLAVLGLIKASWAHADALARARTRLVDWVDDLLMAQHALAHAAAGMDRVCSVMRDAERRGYASGPLPLVGDRLRQMRNTLERQYSEAVHTLRTQLVELMPGTPAFDRALNTRLDIPGGQGEVRLLSDDVVQQLAAWARSAQVVINRDVIAWPSDADVRRAMELGEAAAARHTRQENLSG